MKETKDCPVTGILLGGKWCASQLMSLIEDGKLEGEECLRAVYAFAKESHHLGFRANRKNILARYVREPWIPPLQPMRF